MNKVSVSLCRDYKDAKGSVASAIDRLGGIRRFVKKGKRVLLKPNILSASSPDKQVTTHPEVVRAVVQLVREAGAICYVGDSPGGKVDAEEAARAAGILDVCRREGAIFISLEEPSIAKAGNKQVVVDKKLKDFDFIINMPKAKTHMLTTLTCAVKNLFGCVPGERKAQMHMSYPKPEDFAKHLLDIVQAVKPGLTIVDAVVGMEGNGPANGKPRRLGAIIAGEDSITVDMAVSKAMGIDWRSVPTLHMAEKRGMGLGYQIIGDKLPEENFVLPQTVSLTLIPKFIREGIRDRITAYPYISKRCRNCMACARNCPAKAITGSRKLTVDRSKCIRCFCCQELCPHDAIDVRKSLVARAYDGAMWIYKHVKP